MIWFWFLCSVFVIYRLARLFCIDELPFGAMARFRNKLAEKSGDKQYGLWWTLSELFNCPHCMGVWLGLGIGIGEGVAILGWPKGALTGIFLGLAYSGIQSWLWHNWSEDE